MSSRRTLNPGQRTVFTTRPVGLRTRLFVTQAQPNPSAPLIRFSWHIELCCQSDRVVQGKTSVDISAAAGALVTVKNVDNIAAQVWTDY